MVQPFKPRLIRPLPPPLGLYFRVGYNDHTVVRQLLSEGAPEISGVVLDPCNDERQGHDALVAEVVERGAEALLDPLAMELATPSGFSGRRSKLPWAGERMHEAAALHPSVKEISAQIAGHVAYRSFTGVLSPTHFIEDLDDPWLDIDSRLTIGLREELDRLGRSNALIYYPLALRGKILREPQVRERLVRRLEQLPIDALWLRVHPFGTRPSGPQTLRRYMALCQDFQRLGVPLVGERTGTVGLALLAFGAVGGVESGITLREDFNISNLMRPSTGRKFICPSRVYLPKLGLFLTDSEAEEFFGNRRMKAKFGCQNPRCCRRATEMLQNKRRHFIVRRTEEVSKLSRVPEQLRSRVYLEDFLRPATDLALEASRVLPSLEKLEKHRKRLESWRITLGGIDQEKEATAIAMTPQGRRLHRRIGA